jgi:hypothetical protein
MCKTISLLRVLQMMTFKKAALFIALGFTIGLLDVVNIATNAVAGEQTEPKPAKAPIELWETLCNKPELKSITITATYRNGRVETNDYYCVK